MVCRLRAWISQWTPQCSTLSLHGERTMRWDDARAIKHLQHKAEPHSTGHCAQYVRQAIEAGGVVLLRHGSAKDYGPSLIAVGFTAISAGAGYRHRAGD